MFLFKHSLPPQSDAAPPECGASFWRKHTGDGRLHHLAPNIPSASLFPVNVCIISGSFIMQLLFSQPVIDNVVMDLQTTPQNLSPLREHSRIQEKAEMKNLLTCSSETLGLIEFANIRRRMKLFSDAAG